MTLWMAFCAWQARRHLAIRERWLARFDQANARRLGRESRVG